QLVRTRSWMTLYSPQTARYEVSASPANLSTDAKSAAAADSAPQTRITWNGVPENSYSGMYRLGGFEIARPGYVIADNARAIENLPIPIWSTKSLTSAWHSDQQHLVESDLSGNPAGLIGGLTHHLSAPLEDWVVAYGKMAYVPADNPFNAEATQLR